MLDLSRIRAISLDLDDTLWPIWPTIARAEEVLHAWLAQNAPATAALHAHGPALRAIRDEVAAQRTDLAHDLSALRRESIRLALTRAGDDPALAEPAFDLFFAERMRVQLFDDAADTLAFLAARYPVVAVSNGNADVHRVGIGQYFRGALSAREFGVGKPDARIFHAGAEAAGVPPEAVLHVGDDATLDAWGAVRAGLQAVWLNPQGHEWPHANEPQHHPHAVVDSLTALRALFS